MSQQRRIPSSEYPNNFNISSYSSATKLELPDQSIVYPASSFYVSPMANNHPSPSSSYFYDQQSQFIHQQNSPDSTFMSTSPPPHKMNTCSPSSIMIQEPPMLVASSSSTTTASTMSSSSVEFLNEAFAKASSLPESFYPEFLQYSKEAYEQSTGGGPNHTQHQQQMQHQQQQQQQQMSENNGEESDNDDEMNTNGLTSTEIRRQIHIQSEQKRRAQIKDGFEELRNELPACLNKKMSKVALLHRTVQHIQHLKDTQMSILSELERLVHENEQLRKFQEGVLQKQALENMYTMTNM
ncbi:uncharacterized protein EV154DRAFT_428600 [Mucor mucedo]|uniref:uncharacterized protein n=1 Tax=Mucor mucedo TaxID=29922 RepID=UPI00221E67B7|nr:uncharacterized protein EV154DRAFT_428600 [Mucor mucedo]KAI7881514.1 hypothetical protein EV154DRAFT_428600 [Mucor mucedo]